MFAKKTGKYRRGQPSAFKLSFGPHPAASKLVIPALAAIAGCRLYGIQVGPHGRAAESAKKGYRKVYPPEPISSGLMRCALEADLQIPSELKNNVVFLGVMEGDVYRPKATGFIVCTHMKYGTVLQLVTAEHVIVGLRSKGHKIVTYALTLPA